MDDYKIARDVERGRKATELQGFYEEAFAALEAELTNIWRGTKLDQPEIREEAFLMLRTAERLQSILNNWSNNGKIALAELQLKESRSKK